jgi:hypothetical protein
MPGCDLVLLGRLQTYRGSHDFEWKVEFRSGEFETNLQCQTNYHRFSVWRTKSTTYLVRRVAIGVSNRNKNLPNTKTYQALAADIIQMTILLVLTKCTMLGRHWRFRGNSASTYELAWCQNPDGFHLYCSTVYRLLPETFTVRRAYV